MELLERAGELAELEALVESGRGRLVLIAGEAGIGETSLVRALRDRLAGRATFLIGACEPLSVPVPLAPLRELAGDLAGADSLALARSLLEVLCAPAVAVLEDAHWASTATLNVLRASSPAGWRTPASSCSSPTATTSSPPTRRWPCSSAISPPALRPRGWRWPRSLPPRSASSPTPRASTPPS